MATGIVRRTDVGGLYSSPAITDAEHGNLGGGLEHALVTTTVAGFMSPADKINLNALVAAAGGSYYQAIQNSVGTTQVQRTILQFLDPAFTVSDDNVGLRTQVVLTANGISNALIRQGVGTSVIGRSAGTTGNVSDIVAGADNEVLIRQSGVLDFGFMPYSGLVGYPTITTTTPLLIDGGASADLSTSRTLSIAVNGISDTLIRQGTATSVIGRSVNSTGNVADIISSADGDVLRRAGGILGFGTIPFSSIAGTLLATQFPALTGAVTTSAGSLATTFGTQAGNSLFGVAGSSTAVPAPIVATVANTVAMFDGGNVQWEALPPGATTGIIANWPIANVRWYAISSLMGNDANVGYSDISSADAGTKAKATLAGLGAIFPRVGAGRKVVIVIDSGTYSDPLDLILSGSGGYAATFPLVIATGTNSTANATAFLGDSADRTFVGGVTIPGLNAGGYNPTGTPTTTAMSLQKAGGGAAALPAEPATIGWRIRFDVATATVANRGFCATVVGVPSSSSIQYIDLPAAPSTSDVFYIEQAGVVVAASNLYTAAPGISRPGAVVRPQIQIVGITVNGNLTIGPGRYLFAFVSAGGVVGYVTDDLWTVYNAYRDETGTQRTTGGGLLATGSSLTTTRGAINGYNVGTATFTASLGPMFIDNSNTYSLSKGSYVGAGLVIVGSNIEIGSAVDSPDSTIGNIGSGYPARIVGTVFNGGITAGIGIHGGSTALRGVSITGAGAHPAIGVSPASSISITSGTIGSSGNTDVGLDLTLSTFSRIYIISTPGVTGSLGDVRLADGTIITWAQAQAGISDAAGNTFIGGGTDFPIQRLPAGTYLKDLVGPGTVKGSSAGLLSIDSTTYLADPGGNGIVVRNALGTTINRTFTSTTLTVTNGTGVSGNPNIELPTLVTGLPAPTGTGFAHVSSGAWDAAARAVNLATTDITGLLPLANLTPSGTNTWVLTTTSGVAVWAAPAVGGITQLTGDVTAGPGSGSQIAVNVNLPTGVTQAGYLLATNMVAPSTPASGKTKLYVDLTSKNFASINDLGTVNHGIQSNTGTAHEWVSAIADNGTVTLSQPSFTDISGTITTTQIATGAVTYAKIQTMSANTLLGNPTGSAAAPSEITLGSGLSFSLGVLDVSVGGGGTVTNVSGTAPIFITSTPTSTPNVTIQGAITTGGTSTAATSLGALSSGVLQIAVASSIATPSTYVAGTGHISFGSGVNGQLTDSANLTYVSSVLMLGSSSGGVSIELNQASIQVIDKTGGIFQVGTSDAHDLDFYQNNITQFKISGAQLYAIPLSAGGLVKAAVTTGQLVIATVGVDYQGVITWPFTGEVLYSAGTSTAPVGSAFFVWDTANLGLALGNSGVGNPGNRLYVLPVSSAVASTSYQQNNVFVDGLTLTFSSPTHITTSSGVNNVMINPMTYAASGAMTIDIAATLAIRNAPFAGTNVTISNPYALWVEGGNTLFSGTSNTFSNNVEVQGNTHLDNTVHIGGQITNDFMSGTSLGYVTVNNSGAMSQVVSTIPSSVFKWSFSGGASTGTLLQPNNGGILVPSDSGQISTGGAISGTPGGTIPPDVAATWATNEAVCWYFLPYSGSSYQTATLSISLANCDFGVGIGSLEFSLWECTVPSNSATYTQISSQTFNGALGNSSSLLTPAVTTPLADGIYLFFAVRRTDTNSLSLLQGLNFTAVLTILAL